MVYEPISLTLLSQLPFLDQFSAILKHLYMTFYHDDSLSDAATRLGSPPVQFATTVRFLHALPVPNSFRRLILVLRSVSEAEKTPKLLSFSSKNTQNLPEMLEKMSEKQEKEPKTSEFTRKLSSFSVEKTQNISVFSDTDKSQKTLLLAETSEKTQKSHYSGTESMSEDTPKATQKSSFSVENKDAIKMTVAAAYERRLSHPVVDVGQYGVCFGVLDRKPSHRYVLRPLRRVSSAKDVSSELFVQRFEKTLKF